MNIIHTHEAYYLTGGNILLHPPHVRLYHTLETPTCKPTVTQPNHTLHNSNPYVQISKYPNVKISKIQISDCITHWRPLQLNAFTQPNHTLWFKSICVENLISKYPNIGLYNTKETKTTGAPSVPFLIWVWGISQPSWIVYGDSLLHNPRLSSVSSNSLPEKMHSHIGCICIVFLHCVFSNVTSVRLDQSRHNHTGCICLAFLHCAFLDVSSNR